MTRNSTPTGKASKARSVEKRQQALDLRLAGGSYREIGQQIGISHVQAYRRVDAALSELHKLQMQKAEKLREIELERLEKMHEALWPKVRNGDEKAVRALVAVMDRRAKLLGLDAPTRMQVTGELPPILVVDELTEVDVTRLRLERRLTA